MTSRRISISEAMAVAADRWRSWPLARCWHRAHPRTSAATPTPTKTPRPDVAAADGRRRPLTAPATAAPRREPSAAEPLERRRRRRHGCEPARPREETARQPPARRRSPLAATRTASAGRHDVPRPSTGVQAFLWWREEVADRDLGLIKDAGFHWVKQLFSWQDIEGAGKGKYDWTKTDRIVDQVEKAGLKLIVRVSQDPDRPFWAGNPPDNAGDYADFLAAVASRYKGRIQAYQIWNEPNLAREWGNKRPDPAGYARMLKMAYSAIKTDRPGRDGDHRGHGADRHRHERSDARHQVLRPDVPGDGRQQRRLLRHAGRACGGLCGGAGGQPGRDGGEEGAVRRRALLRLPPRRRRAQGHGEVRRRGQADRDPRVRLDDRRPTRLALLLARRGRRHRRGDEGQVPGARATNGRRRTGSRGSA